MQEINLLLALPVEVSPSLNARRLMQGLVALLLLLLVLSLVRYGQYWHLKSNRNRLVSQQADSAKRLLDYTKNQNVQTGDPLLSQTILRLADHIDEKIQLITILSSREANNIEGFSTMLESVAFAIPEQAWLTQLHFSEGGHLLLLEGKTVSSTAVPNFVTRLSQQVIFTDQFFRVAAIKKREGSPEAVLFFSIESEKS